MAAKRKAGRPVTLPAEQRRRRVLSTRVTEAELGVCMAVAEHHGESLGDWLRRVARTAAGLRP